MAGRRSALEGVAMTTASRPYCRSGLLAWEAVLLTGHTGFKGGWAALWLESMGARVFGLALPPESDPNLYQLADLARRCRVALPTSAPLGDVQQRWMRRSRDRHSYGCAGARAPVGAGARRNIRNQCAGTAHLLDALRTQATVRAILVVTTDKVYAKFRDRHCLSRGRCPWATTLIPLPKRPPKSSRQVMPDILQPARIPLATARGGNVIGGGDFSEDRLVPDIWRASSRGETVVLRYPQATRPWQHVLDCINGYLIFVEALAQRQTTATALNFGPDPTAQLTVATVCRSMQSALGENPEFLPDSGIKPAEMQNLAL